MRVHVLVRVCVCASVCVSGKGAVRQGQAVSEVAPHRPWHDGQTFKGIGAILHVQVSEHQ